MQNYFRHIKVAALAIVIMALSLGDPGDTGHTVFRFFLHADKIVHVIMYLVLTFVIIYEYRREAKKTWVMFFLLFMAFSYSVLMEVLQDKVTINRSFEVYDILANLGGVFMGFMLFLLIRRLFPERFID